MNLGPGSDLQAALNAAKPGDEIVLQAGVTWIGNFFLPAKTCAPMVTLRTSALASLPENVRATPAQVASMASLISPNVNPVISAAPGACGYQIVGIHGTVQLAATSSYGLIVLGDGSETADKLPSNIFISRSWINGLPNFNVKRGVAFNGASLAVIDSTINEIHSQGVDSQAVAGWAGPGPFKIVNNELQAGSEVIAFGGALPSIAGTIPSDIEIRRNHLTRPTSWIGAGWLVKNLFELKNGQRVLFDSNIAEYNWIEGQNGYAVLFQAITQDSGAWAVVSDVTVTNNIIRHTSNGVNLCGTCYDTSGVAGAKTKNVNFKNNLFDDLGNAAYNNNSYPYGVALQNIAQTANVAFDHTSFINANAYDAIQLDGTPSTGLSITNSLLSYGKYGIFGNSCGGSACALSTYAPGAVVTGNLFVNPTPDPGVPGNQFPPTWDSIQFAAFAGGNGGTYQLLPGSPYRGTGSDGKDPGVDWLALTAATKGVLEGTSVNPAPPTPLPPATNTPPVISITAPPNGVTLKCGTVQFHAFVQDGQEPNLAQNVKWSNGITGQVTSISYGCGGPNLGDKVVTATVTDAGGLKATGSVSFTIVKR